MNRPSLLAIVCIFIAATSACTHLFESTMTSWVGSSLDEFEEAYAGQAIQVGLAGRMRPGSLAVLTCWKERNVRLPGTSTKVM